MSRNDERLRRRVAGGDALIAAAARWDALTAAERQGPSGAAELRNMQQDCAKMTGHKVTIEPTADGFQLVEHTRWFRS